MKVVYQSFEGRYGDNPRAIYERWVDQDPSHQHVWFADPAHKSSFPDGIHTVVPYSPECIAQLESADVVVANTHIDGEWTKRPSCMYLQTWHGTPLKRVHADVRWAPPGRLDRLDRDIARWDVLLSPNAESTPRLRSAFRFTGEILEVGSPRNDVLLSADRDLVRDRVRRTLDIPNGATAVLYTPTWRDDVVFDGGDGNIPLGLSAEAFANALGPDYRVLVRVHSLQNDRHAPVESSLVRDVSHYGDVAELYLAADLMITDYSSTMFDFAVTGKPMLFYVFDYERFRDEVRGFYFDLEELAPGPLLRDEDQLTQALLSLDDVTRTYAQRYADFRASYCSDDDGRATERVLRRLENR